MGTPRGAQCLSKATTPQTLRQGTQHSPHTGVVSPQTTAFPPQPHKTQSSAEPAASHPPSKQQRTRLRTDRQLGTARRRLRSTSTRAGASFCRQARARPRRGGGLAPPCPRRQEPWERKAKNKDDGSL